MPTAMAPRLALAVPIATTAIALVPVLAGHPWPDWKTPWLGAANIDLHFALDGISWLFVLLTSLVTAVSIAASSRDPRFGAGYHALVLTLQSALVLVFTARHFIPWFLGWEMTLIPAYLLVRLWGGPNAPKAALRFFLMTLGGSAFLLVGFIALQFAAGTMDFAALTQKAAAGELATAMARAFSFTQLPGLTLLSLAAGAVFLGLAVKIPVVPFHAWLPDAYAEAPTPVTMLLTGLLSKMGVYGLLRMFLPVFAETLPGLAPLLTVLAVATVVLGVFAALAQTDLKRMLAYSSVNHLGYCALAVAAAAASTSDRAAWSALLSGTVLQAVNHGIIASALFFGVHVLESRHGGQRGLHDFGGLRAVAPVLCGAFGLAAFASLGLPGLSGFVGEFLIFQGVFASTPWAAVVSLSGLLLTAVFLLRMIRLVFAGPLAPSLRGFADLTAFERVVFGLAIVGIVIPGLWPQALLRWINPDVIQLLDLFRPLP